MSDLPAKLLRAIFVYISLGWLVFPLRPNKRPYTRNGLKDATVDRDKIEQWWKQNPTALIGVKTGPELGIFVLDLDVDHEKSIDGTKWLSGSEAKHGPLPRAPRARTPRGGYHLYFRYPADRTVKNSAGKLAIGVDVRGEGGYVGCPPSRGARGYYEWEVAPGDCEIPEAPAWLLDLICSPPPSAPASNALVAVPTDLAEADRAAANAEIERQITVVQQAKEGARNHSLNVASFICGKLVGAELADEREVTAKLITAAEVAGLPALEAARTVASGVKAGKRRPWRPHAAYPLLAHINKDHFLALEGRAVFVFREEFDTQSAVRSLAYINPNAFRELFGNQFVQVLLPSGPKILPLGLAWLKWSGRREFAKIVFAPGRELPPTIYNLWQGFAVEAIEGDCSRFLAFMRDVLCANNEEIFSYLIRWCARTVQQPDTAGEVAIVMRGAKGTGKSFFATHLGELFGDHFVQLASSHHLVGTFNAHLETAVLVFADEAFWAGDKQGEGVLKTLITSAKIRVERKGVDSKSVPNRVHLIMASNSDWVVPASADERRYLVIDVGAGRAQDHQYFDALEREWRDGGREALLHDLLNLDISDFNARRVPHSKALLEQKLLSSPPIDRWYLNLLREGKNAASTAGLYQGSRDSGDGADGWAEWVSTADLFEDCKRFASEEQSRLIMSREAFGMRLKRLLPPETEGQPRRVQRQDGSRRVWGYSFPSLELCRRHFEGVIGSPIPWETEGSIVLLPPTKF